MDLCMWRYCLLIISTHCRLAASWPEHLIIATSSVMVFSLRGSPTPSPSMSPLIIWSQMFFFFFFFMVHWSEQKLHILANSRRKTRKSSNDSLYCWEPLRKFLCWQTRWSGLPHTTVYSRQSHLWSLWSHVRAEGECLLLLHLWLLVQI